MRQAKSGDWGETIREFHAYELQEAAGAHTNFTTSKSATDTPVGYFTTGTYPTGFREGRIFLIHIHLNWANAVTLEALRIYQHAAAGDYESSYHKRWDSIVDYPAGLVDDDEYFIYCNIPFYLQTPTAIYYAPQWSGACGNIQGVIEVSGICYL